MKKKKWIITALILLIFCIALGIYNYFDGRKSAPGTEVEEIVAPRRQNILNVNGFIIRTKQLTDGISTIASLLPDEEVDLSFETSGKVVAINFQEGSAVRKGDLLAKVNDKPLQAQLARYEAQLKLAEDRVYRQSALLEKDAVSQEAFEQAQTELATLIAEINIRSTESSACATSARVPTPRRASWWPR